MYDDPAQRGTVDRDRINVPEKDELEYWCKQFGCTPDELREALQKIAIEKQLKVAGRKWIGEDTSPPPG